MDYIVFELSVIIISTAALCFLASIAKQPLIAAYILAGFIVGPHGMNLIHANGFFEALSQVGIVLLLYLIGLELKPRKFAETIKKASPVALGASISLVPLGLLIGWIGELSPLETTYLTISLLFSSTVVVIKTMHDERGVDEDVFNSCVGILLIQDIMAVAILLVINSMQSEEGLSMFNTLRFIIGGAAFISVAFILQRFALRRVLKQIIERTDLMFLMGLAWCFLFAELAEWLHLSREIGGFIAGLSLASLPEYKLRIVINKSETIRDFFMILFFFVLGAQLRLEAIEGYTMVILLTLAVVLIIKPILFYLFARKAKFNKSDSREMSLRLGQNSEFSIIIATIAVTAGHISDSFSMAIQLILFVSIIASNYIVLYITPENLSRVRASRKMVKSSRITSFLQYIPLLNRLKK